MDISVKRLCLKENPESQEISTNFCFSVCSSQNIKYSDPPPFSFYPSTSLPSLGFLEIKSLFFSPI